MQKIFSVSILIIALCFSPVMAFSAPAIDADSAVKAASAIIYDMDNEAILFEQNADEPIPPASLTKIMSMFLAWDYIHNGHARLSDPVTISKGAAAAGGSVMGLHAGESVPFNKLLLGMAVSSGNDASHAVAEFVGGSVNSFVKLMNVKAAQLGMTNSHFVNPHGLPAAGQITTARDMLALARAYLHANPQALAFHNTLTLEHKGYTSWNKNPLLGQYPGADGLKTGWIRASGHNLVFTATRDGHRLLGVILGASDATVRGGEACRLLDAGFIVCANKAVSIAAVLDENPLDLNRVDVLKTARDAGLLKRKNINKRVQGNKRLLANKRSKYQARVQISKSRLSTPKSVDKSRSDKSRATAKSKPANSSKRKTHALRGQKQAPRS